GLKTFLRAEGKLNLKLSSIWLYNRTTPVLRYRDFTEFDSRRDLTVKNEFSLTQADALLVRVWGDPQKPLPKKGFNPEGWVYAEYTGEFVTDAETPPAHPGISRPSLGLIAYAPFGWSGVTLDLDIYYSLLPGSLSGPGGQLFVWWQY